jgi:molybdopterin converting factor small subunit
MPRDVPVTVMLFAALRDRAGCAECTIGVPDATVVGDVWPHLPDRIRRSAAPDGARYAVNDEWADAGRPVAAGDRIALLLPFSGG